MAAVLAWAKRMPADVAARAAAALELPVAARSTRSPGSTLALVGLGGIGTAIARRALAFDMHVHALRRTDAPSPVAGVRDRALARRARRRRRSPRARRARDRQDPRTSSTPTCSRR